MSSESSARFSIGYAMPPKKLDSFIQPSFLDHAKSRGIDLIPIDTTTKPLIEQGPFDCVIHKIYDEEWKKRLIEFSSKNPNVPIIDHPNAIEKLHNRISMLQVVKGLKFGYHSEICCVPNQVVIEDSESMLSDPSVLLGLKFPVIAKPLAANASAKSHELSLVFGKDGLNGLKPPIVLQEFVNHGGVIFKVYVVGEYAQCVKRHSLPNISEEKLGTLRGRVPFSQISNQAYVIEEVEMPPMSFINDVANGLRLAMNLNLFNFDMIRDATAGNKYLVIDINYFPGYAKMPSYETVLTDFLLGILNKKPSEAMSLELKECQESG